MTTLDEHDRNTLDALRANGIGGALLNRVRRALEASTTPSEATVAMTKDSPAWKALVDAVTDETTTILALRIVDGHSLAVQRNVTIWSPELGVYKSDVWKG